MHARTVITVAILAALALVAVAHAQSQSQQPAVSDQDRTTASDDEERMPRDAMSDDAASPASRMQGQDSPEGMQDGNASPDAAFYGQALSSGVGEVELSEHAVENASSEEVRELAGTMVEHHGMLNDKLMSASGMRSPPPPSPSAAAEAAAVKVAPKDRYDRMWLDHMAEGHSRSIALYERTAESADDPKTRALATAALPTIRGHAQTIERLRTGMREDNR